MGAKVNGMVARLASGDEADRTTLEGVLAQQVKQPPAKVEFVAVIDADDEGFNSHLTEAAKAAR